MNEVDLNDPLNWFIADAMDEYDVRMHPLSAKAIVHRHNTYPKLVSLLSEAIDLLEQSGQPDKVVYFRSQLRELQQTESNSETTDRIP
ncbi:MAG: hypothetical protein JOY96_07885 [Verrucomicrobia bacterium]|nr:hypothetical protein [Verrucomicrobiota bacterium]MBV9674169.1 hypothetical protein [Verrucomicrobiota bacterium]